MENHPSSQRLQPIVETIVSSIEHRLTGRAEALVVSLDGGSGAGKSTLAAQAAERLGATVVQCDYFFDATITDVQWDSFPVEKKCHLCINWQRMRNEALLPLLAGKEARYRPFSFSTGNGLASYEVALQPAKVIILDGIYSSLPEMLDVVDLSILVDASPELRRHRHNIREGTDDAEWHRRWDEVEDYYFSVLRPPASYHLIVSNA